MALIYYIATTADVTPIAFSTDSAGPTITQMMPSGTGASPYRHVSCSLRETGGAGVQKASINIVIEGIDAIVAGVIQAGYVGSFTANAFNGYDISVRQAAPFPANTQIDVDIEAADFAGNATTASYSYTTASYATRTRYMLVGGQGIIREFDPVTQTFSADKDSGTYQTLFCIASDIMGRHIYVGGDGGTLLHSSDSGETWLPITGFVGPIYNVVVVSENEVYVWEVTSTWKLHKFNGSTWSLISDTSRVHSVSLWGEHNNIYQGLNHGSYNAYSLKYYNGSTFEIDNSLPTFASEGVTVSGGKVRNTGEHFMLAGGNDYWGVPDRVYKGQFNAWLVDHAWSIPPTEGGITDGAITYLPKDDVFIVKGYYSGTAYYQRRAPDGSWTPHASHAITMYVGFDAIADDNICSAAGSNTVTFWDGATFTNYYCTNPRSHHHYAVLALPGTDTDPPTFVGASPTGIDVPRTTSIFISIRDIDGSGVDPNRIQAVVAGVDAVIDGVIQGAFSLSTIVANAYNGYDVTLVPNVYFTAFTNVDVAFTAEDLASNSQSVSWSFQTVDDGAPTVQNKSPLPYAKGIALDTTIAFDIVDVGAGVNAASVVVTITFDSVSYPVWQNDAAQEGFAVIKTGIANGFNYVITPVVPFALATMVYIRVQGEDLATVPNSVDTTWEFTTNAAPQIFNQNPYIGERDVLATAPFYFAAQDDVALDFAETWIFVNKVLIYTNETAYHGFVVTRTLFMPEAAWYRYTVTPPRSWTYNQEVKVRARIKDTSGLVADASWSFFIEDNVTCFKGPLNTFELSLLVPYDHAARQLYYTDQLRALLIRIVVDRPDPIKAMRQIFLRAFQTDLAPVLRGIVTAPTAEEKEAVLCYRRTVIEIHADLQTRPGILEAALAELKGMGLPREHGQLLQSYFRTEQPQDQVLVACFMVCLAKALETNELRA